MEVAGLAGISLKPKPLVGHGLVYRSSGPAVVAPFHPSRQNTNTKKLTPLMFEHVFPATAIAATGLAAD